MKRAGGRNLPSTAICGRLRRWKFVAEVEPVAEVLAARLGQDEIVVQFQRDGLPVETCAIKAAQSGDA